MKLSVSGETAAERLAIALGLAPVPLVDTHMSFLRARAIVVATKLGMTAETLRKWVRQAERDTGRRPGLTTSERERLVALEPENRELQRTNEILKSASAYFAQACGAGGLGVRPPPLVS